MALPPNRTWNHSETLFNFAAQKEEKENRQEQFYLLKAGNRIARSHWHVSRRDHRDSLGSLS